MAATRRDISAAARPAAAADDAFERIRKGVSGRDFRLQLLADYDTAVVALNRPAADGIEGRGSQCLACTQGGPRMMKQTEHGLTIDDP